MLQSEIEQQCSLLDDQANRIIGGISLSKHFVERSIDNIKNARIKLEKITVDFAQNESEAITSCLSVIENLKNHLIGTQMILEELISVLNQFRVEITQSSQKKKHGLRLSEIYAYFIPDEFKGDYINGAYSDIIVKYQDMLYQVLRKFPYQKDNGSGFSDFGKNSIKFAKGFLGRNLATIITDLSVLPYFDVILKFLNPNLTNEGELIGDDSMADDEYKKRHFNAMCEINQFRVENNMTQIEKDEIPDIEALLLQTITAYKSVGESVSPIQIFRNKKTNGYTVIFPATVGDIPPNKWATNSLNNWGSNNYAIKKQSALVAEARGILERKAKEDGQDIKNINIMTVGFSQGGINAASFASKYENELNIKQVVTLGSPIAHFKIEKANVLAYEQKHAKNDIVPYLDTPYSLPRMDGWRLLLPGQNKNSHNWQTIKVDNIMTPLIGEDSADSIAPGHDPGNYALGARGVKINSIDTIKQFLGSKDVVSQKTYFIHSSKTTPKSHTK